MKKKVDLLLGVSAEEEPPVKAEGFISTEQRQAYTHFQRKVLEWMANQGCALIKVDRLEPDATLPQGGFLISYKIRQHDIEMVKLPFAHTDHVWTMLALQIEKRSRELG